MKVSTGLALLFAFLLVCFAAVARSQEEVKLEEVQEFAQDSEEVPKAEAATEAAEAGEAAAPSRVLHKTDDITSTFLYPQYGNKKVIAGRVTELLVGIINGGSVSYNVTHLAASLVHPFDYSYALENFTAAAYGEGVVVGPSELKSFSYYFVPNEQLEPRDYGLTVTAYFEQIGEADRKIFAHLVYNGTVTIIEPPSTFDVQLFFTYCGIAGVVGLIGYFIFTSLFSKSIAKRTRAKIEYGTKSEVSLDSEWLEGTHAFSKKKGAKPKRN